MTKLIKTSLLNNGNTSDIAKITASTKDYCNFRYERAMEGFNLKEILVSILAAIGLVFVLIVFLPVKLTGGLIMYPVWMLQHYALKKNIIKAVKAENKTIADLNKKAKKIEAKSKN